MSELVYDINTVLKEGLDWATLNDGVVPDFIPVTGYDDLAPPFILYAFIPKKHDIERWYILHDIIRYYVYDTDIERMWAISRAMRNYLNVADDVAEIKSNMPVDSEFNIFTSELMDGVTSPPSEREGFLNTNNEFRIKYVLL